MTPDPAAIEEGHSANLSLAGTAIALAATVGPASACRSARRSHVRYADTSIACRSLGVASSLGSYVDSCFSPQSGAYRLKTSVVSATVNGVRITSFVPGFWSSDFGLRAFLIMALNIDHLRNTTRSPRPDGMATCPSARGSRVAACVA